MLEWLASLFAGGPDIDWRVRQASKQMKVAGGTVSIHRVARAVGMSPRTLQHVIRTEVGLGPKRMSRIARLQAALARSLEAPHRTWSVIAGETGYCDQAHLIHDAHELLGETPGRFRARGLDSAVADSYKRPDCDPANL